MISPTRRGGRADSGAAGLATSTGGRYYRATDNLKSSRLKGRSPADVISEVDRSGLSFDSATGTGIALHLLGALPTTGKLGATCIAATPEAADEKYRALLDLVGADLPA